MNEQVALRSAAVVALLALAACGQEKRKPVDTTLPNDVAAVAENTINDLVPVVPEEAQVNETCSGDDGTASEDGSGDSYTQAPVVTGGPRQLEPINPAGWVTTDDYPARPLREGVEGVTVIALAVDPQGRVSGCEVTASSGSADLDDATCRTLTRRGRFTAARDNDGSPVSASYFTRIRWTIPR